jgi:hypothetical protein
MVNFIKKHGIRNYVPMPKHGLLIERTIPKSLAKHSTAIGSNDSLDLLSK